MFKDIFVISSIILAISFLVILIYNQKIKNKIIKIMFLIFSSTFIILIFIFDYNYIYELLRSLITYFWYPNYLIFVNIILFAIIIFIVTLLKKEVELKIKIKNYILFVFYFVIYNIYSRLGIDTSLYESLYSPKSLVLMRIITISFAVWLIITFGFKMMKRGKNEK